MALPLSMFTKGLLITTPPCIYIFMGDIPVNSLFGSVASVSQDTDMSSNDPNALPLEDSSVLPPTPVNPPENNALPPSNPVVENDIAKVGDPEVSTSDSAVDNGTSQNSKSGVSTGDPVVSNDVANNSNPGISTSNSVVVDDIARESAPKASTGEPEVSKELSQEGVPEASNGPSSDSAPGVSRSDSTVDSGASENSKPGVANELSGDSVPREDDLSEVDDEDEDDEEPAGDTSKNNELNEELRKAGIDDSCFLPNLQTVGTCTLDKDQMLKINFPQRDSFRDEEEDDDLEISGLKDGEKVTLTIESGYDEEDFPKGGLRLTFHNPNSNEIKITGEGNNDAILKPNIDYDYKFSYATENWLDKAWNNLQKLGAKVGLNINDSVQDECTPGQVINKEINVWKGKREYVKGALSDSSSECLMKHESDVKNLLEGFKLTVREGKDIALTGGEGPSKGRKIDTLKKDAYYSFAPKNIGGKRVWFLIERSS